MPVGLALPGPVLGGRQATLLPQPWPVVPFTSVHMNDVQAGSDVCKHKDMILKVGENRDPGR